MHSFTSLKPTTIRALRVVGARLAHDVRGATMIEFAICSSMFFALLLACAQTALVFFVQQAVQTTAEEVARKVMTGAINSANSSQTQFQTAACNSLPSFLSCSNLFVSAQTAGSFAALDTSRTVLTYDSKGKLTNTWPFQTGGSGDIVILRIMYRWQTQMGPLGFDLSDQTGGIRLITGTMVFKSEPYS